MLLLCASLWAVQYSRLDHSCSAPEQTVGMLYYFALPTIAVVSSDSYRPISVHEDVHWWWRTGSRAGNE